VCGETLVGGGDKMFVKAFFVFARLVARYQ
jgi:hypothetical protein